MSDKPMAERVAIVETEVSIIKDDMNDIKNDITQLKNNQIETNLSIKELTVLLGENTKTYTQVLQQNSTVISEMSNKILDTFTSTIKNNNKTTNKIRLLNKKEVWAILGAIVTFVITYLSNK